MSIFGIRRRLKTGIKKILREDESSEVVPPNSYSADAETPTPTVKTAPPVDTSSVAPEPSPEPEVKEAVAEAPTSAETIPEESSESQVVTPHQPDEDVIGQPLTMEAVQEILDDMVRPALQGDGGDISLIKIEQNNIYVQLVGACSTCPSSVMTMKMGVEALLREEFPSMNELIDIGAAP